MLKISFPSRYPVSTIISFNQKGEICINALGIEFNGIRYRYKIESSTIVEEVGAYLKFRCIYLEFETIKSINLVYFLRDHKWTTE